MNLKEFFEREARNIVKTQKSLLTNKKGVAQSDQAPHNAASTIKRKGFDHWLKATDETRKNVFQFETTPSRMTLFASEEKHSGRYPYMTKSGKKIGQAKNPPKYSQLIEWHTRTYSGFYRGIPAGSQFPQRLKAEIVRQLGNNIQTRFRKFFK